MAILDRFLPQQSKPDLPLPEGAEHLIDFWARNIEHGRFERALSGLTAAGAILATSEVYYEHYKENSVVDSDHRVWGVPNLFLADGSVCPTQDSANPALTIMALASRLAERLKHKSPERERTGAIGAR